MRRCLPQAAQELCDSAGTQATATTSYDMAYPSSQNASISAQVPHLPAQQFPEMRLGPPAAGTVLKDRVPSNRGMLLAAGLGQPLSASILSPLEPWGAHLSKQQQPHKLHPPLPTDRAGKGLLVGVRQHVPAQVLLVLGGEAAVAALVWPKAGVLNHVALGAGGQAQGQEALFLHSSCSQGCSVPGNLPEPLARGLQ